MILAIIFAQVWGVFQLIVLTSLSRTVRVRTVFTAMAVGFYAIGPFTAFLQVTWIRIVAHVFGKGVVDLTGVAGYTVDPFIEEAMKLTPLLLLMLIPAIRRQWSVSDCFLMAGATGSGFGLAEHLFRYADYASTAQSVSGGYMMIIGSATPLVPGIGRSLTSWIPRGVYFATNAAHLNWHLAWSAICGLAIGLLVRYPKRIARVTAVGLLILMGLDHAAGNADSIETTWLAWFAAPLHILDGGLSFLVLVAGAVAWYLDQPLQRAGMALGPLLAAEQSASSRLVGTFSAAMTRLPWSIPWVWGFDRERRAYHAARAASPGPTDDLGDAMVAERDRVDRKLSQQAGPPLFPPDWMPRKLGTTLRIVLLRPSVIIWLVLIAPSMLYLVIGGFPAASGLQAVMKERFVWPLVLLITLLGQGRRAWRVLAGIRMLPVAIRHPIGDDAAMLALQAATGLGTLSLAGFTFARVLSGVEAGERMLFTAHAAQAMNRTQPAGGAAIAGSVGALDPPRFAPVGNAAPPAPAAAPAAGAAGAGAEPAGQESNKGPADAFQHAPSPNSLPPPYPPPPSADLPEDAPDNEEGVGTRYPDDAAPDSPTAGTTDGKTPPMATMAPATQAEIDAAAGKAPVPTATSAPTLTPVSQADIDAASGKLPGPTATSAPTLTPVSQADIDAASGNGPAPAATPGPTLTPVSQADIDAANGGPDAIGTGERVPEHALPPRSVPASPSAQDQASKALARAEQADDDQVAAQKELARLEQADDDAVAAEKAADDARRAADHALNAGRSASNTGSNGGDGSNTVGPRKWP